MNPIWKYILVYISVAIVASILIDGIIESTRQYDNLREGYCHVEVNDTAISMVWNFGGSSGNTTMLLVQGLIDIINSKCYEKLGICPCWYSTEEPHNINLGDNYSNWLGIWWMCIIILILIITGITTHIMVCIYSERQNCGNRKYSII